MDRERLKSAIRETIRKEKGAPELRARPKRTTTYRIIVLSSLITTCLILLLFLGPSLFSSPPPKGPWGKIHLPTPGSETGPTVGVRAETRNIPAGQYLWLAVDKPALGLCWPKFDHIHPNIMFQTTIQEGGPKEFYTISLYSLNETLNDQWTQWMDRQLLGGLPIPPDSRRLASVRLYKNR